MPVCVGYFALPVDTLMALTSAPLVSTAIWCFAASTRLKCESPMEKCTATLALANAPLPALYPAMFAATETCVCGAQ